MLAARPVPTVLLYSDGALVFVAVAGVVVTVALWAGSAVWLRRENARHASLDAHGAARLATAGAAAVAVLAVATLVAVAIGASSGVAWWFTRLAPLVALASTVFPLAWIYALVRYLEQHDGGRDISEKEEGQ